MYSADINKLMTLARRLGWPVRFYSEEGLSGRCKYRPREILLAEPLAFYALMTLAHEIGHALYHIRLGKKKSRSKIVKERAAYLYGWGVLRHIGCKVISKTDWREHHQDVLSHRRQ